MPAQGWRHTLVRCTIAWLLISAAFSALPQSIEGHWNGTLQNPKQPLRLVLEMTKADDGTLRGSLTSVDQNGVTFPIERVEVEGNRLRFDVGVVRGKYEGSLSADNNRISGSWTQRSTAPLEFVRSAAAAVPRRRPAEVPDLSGFSAMVAADVPAPPIPIRNADQTLLVYELHLSNVGAPVTLTRVDVLDARDTIAMLQGEQLVASTQTFAAEPGTLGVGRHVTIYMWVTMTQGRPVPSKLRHVLTFANGQVIESEEVVLSDVRTVVIGPPLRGSDWEVRNGPSNISGHRRGVIALNGKARVPQRFAIDWVKTDSDGKPFHGSEKDNNSYFGYGSEVIAVADGVVALTADTFPDNTPHPSARAVTITPETAAGNFVSLDLGGGRFAVYAHLQPGSVRVKAGERVRRGQLLGRIGNSGNSTGPHLHFHVADGKIPLQAEGVPFQIDAFEQQRGRARLWNARKNEMPLDGDRLRFP